MNKSSIKAQFVLEKLTRNTARYSEVSTNYIGTVYVQKETFNGGDIPKRMTLTLSFDD